MTSVDVIHSFWVPEFRVERDIIPGTYAQLQITPIRLGTYQLRCAMLCGLSYDEMLADVNVMQPADFEMWVTHKQMTDTNP